MPLGYYLVRIEADAEGEVSKGLQQEETNMIRFAAVAFLLAVMSPAQAMPLGPVQQSDEMVVQVREACGSGMRRTANGNCIRTAARRKASRCVRGVTC
jgi:hypothetical protein